MPEQPPAPLPFQPSEPAKPARRHVQRGREVVITLTEAARKHRAWSRSAAASAEQSRRRGRGGSQAWPWAAARGSLPQPRFPPFAGAPSPEGVCQAPLLLWLRGQAGQVIQAHAPGPPGAVREGLGPRLAQSPGARQLQGRKGKSQPLRQDLVQPSTTEGLKASSIPA